MTKANICPAIKTVIWILAGFPYPASALESNVLFDLSGRIHNLDSAVAPFVVCQSSTLSSVTFAWTTVSETFGYIYQINQEDESGINYTEDSLLVVNDLQEGDEVILSIWSVGIPPNTNSDTVFITCATEQCANATLTIPHPGVICSDGNPIWLNVLVDGDPTNFNITWSGPAIIDPAGLFDPALSTSGANTVSVIVENEGCMYSTSREIGIVMTPIASFEIHGVPCLDSTLHLLFNGYAFFSSDWYWDLAGANVEILDRPVDYALKWDNPGDYYLSLFIDYRGCVSDTFVFPIQIDQPLEVPQINCLEEDYYSLEISWAPVNGSSGYVVSSSHGVGRLSGNSYSITGISDDTAVDITVTAIGSACGTSSASIQCKTRDYFPPAIYVADIFSPNGDGINDKILIHTNSKITEVNEFRIFDRLGNMVFENLRFKPNDVKHGWDGTFSGYPLNPGVYAYQFELETDDGEVIRQMGDFTLIR